MNDKASFKIQLLGYLKSLRTCFPRDIMLFVYKRQLTNFR